MNNLTLEPSAKLSNFHADLAMSDSAEIEQAINKECRKYFPELLNITKAHKLNDILGADYFLEFPNCKMESLDIKVRKNDYSLRGDDRTACIELVANTTTRKKGWTLDPNKHTDWIMFYYIETGKTFLYNARLLRAAVTRYLPDLRKHGKSTVQQTQSVSGHYESDSLMVSHRELGAAIYRNTNHSTATTT